MVSYLNLRMYLNFITYLEIGSKFGDRCCKLVDTPIQWSLWGGHCVPDEAACLLS